MRLHLSQLAVSTHDCTSRPAFGRLGQSLVKPAISGDITMKTLSQRLCVGLLALLGCLWVANMTACNTVKGAGEDVQSVGHGIEGAAEGADNADSHNP